MGFPSTRCPLPPLILELGDSSGRGGINFCMFLDIFRDFFFPEEKSSKISRNFAILGAKEICGEVRWSQKEAKSGAR